ncbi:hypothetical protein CNR22_07055 [Sphingobacteriaceae bacterium]|nr:hypothetical protein CNR22_07055 [Sphingobacteriaceae bacterium]
MENNFIFTYKNLEQHYQEALESGYDVITCAEFTKLKNNINGRKLLVNRVDIDLSVKKTKRLIDIFNKLNIKASFFLRLHAPEYNPFSFENYKIIKYLIESGHELGYHSEIVDQSVIWNEDAADCLRRDIDVINRMFNIEVKGVASHGGMTGLNNLDFWKDKKPSDFGLLYEGYDHQPEYNLFQESFYVSDSEWTRWKCYNKGKLVQDDRRNFAEHAKEGHSLLHVLIHPDTYFDDHFYENEK